MAKRLVEVFTAGCPVCEEAVSLVKELACPSCEVVVYDLNKGCQTNICREKAKNYGIKRLPAIIIDGRVSDCCAGRGPDKSTLKAAGLGKAI